MEKPKSLKRGDKAAVVSLSSGLLGEKPFLHKYEIARERMEKLYGIHLVPMENTLKGVDYLEKHPEKRAEDLMNAFKDPEIKGVFNAIGGEDTIRLLPYIDFSVLKENPKIFTGFSDTTVNHFMMYKAGIVSFYGLSLMNQLGEYVEMNPYTKNAFEKTLLHPAAPMEILPSEFCSYEKDKIFWGEEHTGESTPRYPNSGYEMLQGEGTVKGALLGGCIDTFVYLIGTPLWPSKEEWKGKILLLETSEENMEESIFKGILRNLGAEGILEVLSGIIVGKPAYEEKGELYKAALKQVVGEEYKRKDLPILWNVNIGHAYPSGVLPLGLTYEINSEKKSLRLLEKATEDEEA